MVQSTWILSQGEERGGLCSCLSSLMEAADMRCRPGAFVPAAAFGAMPAVAEGGEGVSVTGAMPVVAEGEEGASATGALPAVPEGAEEDGRPAPGDAAADGDEEAAPASDGEEEPPSSRASSVGLRARRAGGGLRISLAAGSLRGSCRAPASGGLRASGAGRLLLGQIRRSMQVLQEEEEMEAPRCAQPKSLGSLQEACKAHSLQR